MIINSFFRAVIYFILLSLFGLFTFVPTTDAAELYKKTKIENGQLQIITTKNKIIIPPKRTLAIGKDTTLTQESFDKIAISEDKTIVGWLAYYPNCATSYPIPLELIIFKNGQIKHVFKGAGHPIWQWQFVQKGARVAFEQETVHGGMGIHYELREIKTGHLIDSYDGEPKQDAPKWVHEFKFK